MVEKFDYILLPTLHGFFLPWSLVCLYLHRMLCFFINDQDIFALFMLNTEQEWEAREDLGPLHFDRVWYLKLVKLCPPENRSLDTRNSRFPPSLCSSLLSVFLSYWLRLFLPCRRRIKFAVASSSFSFLEVESHKSFKKKTPAGGFSPTADRFHSAATIMAHTHTHIRTSYHTVFPARSPRTVDDCPAHRGQLVLQVKDPSLYLPQRSDWL